MDASNWQWGPAWRKLREDVNILAWLYEEAKYYVPKPKPEIVEPWHGHAGPAPHVPPA